MKVIRTDTEFNWVHPPPARLVVPCDAGFCWDHTDYHGASLAATAELGRSKDYVLVATDSSQGNAYFVRRDTAAGKFKEQTPESLWSEAPWGSHPHSDRPWLDLGDQS